MRLSVLPALAICHPLASADVRASETTGLSVGEGFIENVLTVVWAALQGLDLEKPHALSAAVLAVFAYSFLRSAGAALVPSRHPSRPSALRRIVGFWARRGRKRTEQKCRQLFNSAGTLLVHAHRLVSAMGAMEPLQKVLRHELALVARRLLTVAPTVSKPGTALVPAADTSSKGRSPNWDRLQKQLRSSIQDLNRLVEIAEAAGARRQDSATPLPLPATKDEAYEVLGINVHAGDAALKKLVDALRQCWNPEFARDEADRRHREERIRQIDAAWDMIAAEDASALPRRRVNAAGRLERR
ncbi:MAG: hypothetical protein ACREC6_14345 [Hyphomicrobiaceae bacterium]